MIPKIEDILKIAKMHPSRVYNIYLFGSRVYSTHTEDSDWDVIIVGKYSVESIEIKSDLFNIHIYTPDKWQKDLDWHMPKNIECQFAPSWTKLKEDMKFNFTLDHPKLRHATSHVSSNSWVKAKKKLTLEKEYNIGVKSLFHSIRIPMFSTQLAKLGYIEDFKCANHIWYRICEKEWTWDELYEEFKKEHNTVLTEFRKLVGKE